MNIVTIAVGTRGDVQPYVALGKGLRRAGHNVTIATHINFESFVRENGIEFYPLRADIREALESPAGSEWLSGGNPVQFLQQFKALFGPRLVQILADCWEACVNKQADAILYSPLGYAAPHIAEKLNLPCFAAPYMPFGTRSRVFPSIAGPTHIRGGGFYNWLTHVFENHTLWYPLRSIINQWRQEHLNLSPLPLTYNPTVERFKKRLPMLFGYSPSVIPKPWDWPPQFHVTGYWFLDHKNTWKPQQKLIDFISSGTKPIYIGFGSMSQRDPEILTDITIKALKKTNQRGILVSGWGGLKGAHLSDDIFIAEDVPHDWLFNQMKAVIHHGGCGTTAAGLRAGVPNIIIPFFADQPFWGRRIADIGVGPEMIPKHELTVDRLVNAINETIQSKSMQQKASRMGELIRAEKGVTQGVKALNYHLAQLQSAR